VVSLSVSDHLRGGFQHSLALDPNGYLAGLIGVGLAYGLTVALGGLWRLAESRLRKGQVFSGQPSKRTSGLR
jgi:hypothetical protein